jgi:hypothetical protein
VDEFCTVTLSEEFVGLIDWRKPRSPVWISTEQSSANMSLFHRKRNNTGDDEIVVFSEEGHVSILDIKTGSLLKNSPTSLQSREEMQLPCGTSSLFSRQQPEININNNDDRFAVVASTFGFVSLLDLETWNILGTAKLGGMKDDENGMDQDEDVDQQKSAIEKMTNPPLLASLDCIISPFLIGSNQNSNRDDNDDEGNNISKNNVTSSFTSSTALVSRADGVVAFAHLQPNTYPSVTRLADVTVTDLSNSLSSANWICHCANTLSSSSGLVSCVATNGIVSLWQVPAEGFSLASEEREEEETNAAELKQIDSVNVMQMKYTANDAQRKVVEQSVEMNCSHVVTKGTKQGLIVGDSSGRILWIDIAS